jgi:hypothetical protein
MEQLDKSMGVQSTIFHALALVVNVFCIYLVALFSYSEPGDLYKASLIICASILVSLISIAFQSRTVIADRCSKLSVIIMTFLTLIKLASMF